MFEKLTDRARQVVVLSQDEARTLGHGSIGTEHILLGLLREGGGIAAQVLVSLGLSLEDVRLQVKEIVGHGPTAAPGQPIPFTPAAAAVLQGAVQESLQRGHDRVGTEHILLALLRDRESAAAQVLVRRGADLDHAARATEELVRQYYPIR
ncbi:Clp protease N-terminal domain-containing protein [Microbispora sp. NPDC046973]|uniref:Clp protease N-terminal domain-containing protein n=1 Tax=Microbispora sp. NPDC046973 TaxID=3155022 RepID=UPI003402EA56